MKTIFGRFEIIISPSVISFIENYTFALFGIKMGIGNFHIVVKVLNFVRAIS